MPTLSHPAFYRNIQKQYNLQYTLYNKHSICTKKTTGWFLASTVLSKLLHVLKAWIVRKHITINGWTNKWTSRVSMPPWLRTDLVFTHNWCFENKKTGFKEKNFGVLLFGYKALVLWCTCPKIILSNLQRVHVLLYFCNLHFLKTFSKKLHLQMTDRIYKHLWAIRETFFSEWRRKRKLRKKKESFSQQSTCMP